MKGFIRAIITIPNKIYNYIMFAWRKPICVGYRPRINGKIYMVSDKSAISFGRGVCINSSLKSNPIGGSDRTILFAEHGAVINIGNNVGISNSAIYAAQSVTIEDNVMIGGDCRIYDTDFHGIKYDERLNNVNIKASAVEIKNGAFIGSHCIVLKGVSIGEKAVIGAGSVVTKSVPAGEIWAGNPAKYIKKVD